NSRLCRSTIGFGAYAAQKTRKLICRNQGKAYKMRAKPAKQTGPTKLAENAGNQPEDAAASAAIRDSE
ncbi:MAG: hypothetical protein ACK40A_14550, partial [Pannonibacter indicus]